MAGGEPDARRGRPTHIHAGQARSMQADPRSSRAAIRMFHLVHRRIQGRPGTSKAKDRTLRCWLDSANDEVHSKGWQWTGRGSPGLPISAAETNPKLPGSGRGVRRAPQAGRGRPTVRPPAHNRFPRTFRHPARPDVQHDLVRSMTRPEQVQVERAEDQVQDLASLQPAHNRNRERLAARRLTGGIRHGGGAVGDLRPAPRFGEVSDRHGSPV